MSSERKRKYRKRKERKRKYRKRKEIWEVKERASEMQDIETDKDGVNENVFDTTITN